jgi:hypothetical protein
MRIPPPSYDGVAGGKDVQWYSGYINDASIENSRYEGRGMKVEGLAL